MNLVGNYELVAQLASGGMAETHIARCLTDDAIAVIKLLLPRFASDPEFIEMFVDEGRVISSLHHPNVVGMRDFGFHNEIPYLAMEYLHGVDLRTLARTRVLRRATPLPVDVALFIATSMCAGLHHAHEAHTIDGKPMEITHRDVSPQNVVLTFDGDVKLIDFGIATARGRLHETRGGALKGKVPYMAPEQVRAGCTDRRTDVYATGVVLYEMLTSRRPYVGKHAKMGEFSLMMAIVNNELVPIETLRDLPPALAGVVMRSLALDPSRRFQTAAEFEHALCAAATQLGMTLSASSLSAAMVETLGPRRVRPTPTTSAQVIELVTEIEDVRTNVDDSNDPSIVDSSELKSLGRAKTDPHSSTAPRLPEFGDVVVEATPIAATPVVDKVIEADTTRLTFHRQPEDGFRWGRLFDGIEGVVEVDFSGLPALSRPSVVAATEVMRGLGEEVREIRLIAVPIPLAIELEDRCTIMSVSSRGSCLSCRTMRTAMFGYDEVRERLAGGLDLPCPRCGTGLMEIDFGSPHVTATGAAAPVIGSRSSIRMLAAAPPVSLRYTSSPFAAVSLPGEPVSPTATIAGGGRGVPAHLRLYVGVATVAVAIAGFALVWVAHGGAARDRPAPGGQVAAEADPSLGPDAWSVELAGDGASERETMTALHLRAIGLAIAQIESELPAELQALRTAPTTPVVNLEAAEGAEIRLEQATPRWDRSGARPRATVRYSVTAATRARLRTYYSQVRTVWGLELVHAPPSRPRGVLVLRAPDGGVAMPGDRLLAIGDQPVNDLADVPADGKPAKLLLEHPERHVVSLPRSE